MDGQRWLSLIALVGVLLLVGPAALRMQRGRNWLLSVAVWLGIAVALMLAYRLFGPGG